MYFLSNRKIIMHAFHVLMPQYYRSTFWIMGLLPRITQTRLLLMMVVVLCGVCLGACLYVCMFVIVPNITIPCDYIIWCIHIFAYLDIGFSVANEYKMVWQQMQHSVHVWFCRLMLQVNHLLNWPILSFENFTMNIGNSSSTNILSEEC